jgi:hypothetical protein
VQGISGNSGPLDGDELQSCKYATRLTKNIHFVIIVLTINQGENKMGFVVYEKVHGSVEAYYKKESSAKASVTRLNKQLYTGLSREVAYCSWADYELLLDGMSPSQISFYRFATHPLNFNG